MKIISKYKDFYDYLLQDHDSDLVYERKIGFVKEYYDDLFKNSNNRFTIPYFNNYYGYQDRYISYRESGEFIIDNIIFGIYPYVYSQPVIKLFYRHIKSNNIEFKTIILSKEQINSLEINSTEKFENFIQGEFDKIVDEGLCKPTKVVFPMFFIHNSRSRTNNINAHIWKQECKELFYKIGSPVFVKYYNILFEHSAYDKVINEEIYKDGRDKFIHYVTNISFQKLNLNILKYWYDELNDINTYNNIENFLWSIKQEPIANPDNKTKILSHGFDLKTSFRKM